MNLGAEAPSAGQAPHHLALGFIREAPTGRANELLDLPVGVALTRLHQRIDDGCEDSHRRSIGIDAERNLKPTKFEK